MRRGDRREKMRHVVGWVALVSAFGHIFCCGLPMLMGVFGLLAGFGMFSTLLPGYNALHDALRPYEVHILLFSLAILCVGWGLQLHADHVDCHDSGCHHGPCAPAKRRVHKILWFATFLFLFNAAMMLFMHRHDGRVEHDHVPTMVVKEHP